MIEDEKKIEEVNISEVQPSQLYLSSRKLEEMDDESDLEPLPIKRIGDRVFFTDGHHRAHTLFERGIEKVEVYEDHDDLDWLAYLICVDWCEKEGLRDIGDLNDRIIDEESFKEAWIGRCQRMHRDLEEDIFHHVKIVEENEPNIKSEICKTILRSLPEYFGIDEAVEDYLEGVKKKYFLSARVGKIPIGFMCVKNHNEFTSELYVLGIVKELHGRGIGSRFLDEIEEQLIKEGKEYLTVKTLSPSHPEKGPYDKTRSFYRSVGFVPLEEFPTLWDEDNPCLFMVKSLD
ncbi:MAG: GNAT family N-acetyltransferase [Candidatus Aenigmatarchaeota archaeon]